MIGKLYDVQSFMIFEMCTFFFLNFLRHLSQLLTKQSRLIPFILQHLNTNEGWTWDPLSYTLGGLINGHAYLLFPIIELLKHYHNLDSSFLVGLQHFNDFFFFFFYTPFMARKKIFKFKDPHGFEPKPTIRKQIKWINIRGVMKLFH